MNKPIALPFGSMPPIGLNSQVTLAPGVGTVGVLAGCTATGGCTVLLGISARLLGCRGRSG